MKCILHIGTEKTGTTTLQEWLYDNKQALSQEGFYLSDNLGNPNNYLIPIYFNECIDSLTTSLNIENLTEKNKYFSSFLDNLNKEITHAKSKHHTFLMTSEHLHSHLTKEEDIKNLKYFLSNNFEEIKIICYFREQYNLAISLYTTSLKINETLDIDSFLSFARPANYYFNHLNIANNWAGVFGQQNCIFKIYDKKLLLNNDIRKDFLSVICYTKKIELLNNKITLRNESLFKFQAAAYKYINKIMPYNSNFKDKNLKAKKKIDSMDELKVGKISSPLINEIRDRFKEVNKSFFEKYFDSRVNFVMNDEKIPNYLLITESEKIFEAGLELGAYLQGKKNN